MNKSLLLILFAFASICSSSAQTDDLPRYMTTEEAKLMEDYLATRTNESEGIDNPPPFPVRSMAEWEEIQSLVIAWTSYPRILREITRYAKEECEVIIICSNPNSVVSYLNAGGVDTNNVSLVVDEYNSVWMRDYGGNTIYSEDLGELMLVDWIYNRPRYQDDLVPESVAEHIGIPLYTTTAAPNDLVHTGGNYMSDGFGTAFSSRLVIDENGPGGFFNISNKTEEDIDQLMLDFMGIQRYPKMTNLPYDLIHHIDMHMKLLDEETLLVGEYPDGVADGPQIEANIQYVLNNFESMFGTPYKLVRIQMPPDGNNLYPDGPFGGGDYRTFTNSVIVNKTILVPVYEEQYDSTALRIYRENMPGYKVVGIECNDIIRASGAIHCITKAVGADQPLLISHQALKDVDHSDEYKVNAYIRHSSGIQKAEIFFRTSSNPNYQSLPMTLTDSVNFNWTGYIPGQAAETVIDYYIAAEAKSGKQQVRPMPAPEGYWQFEVIPLMTSTSEFNLNTQMDLVFPNPASAITCIPIHSKVNTSGTITLYNMLGQEMINVHQGRIPAGESKYFFFANQLSPGTYMIQLATEQGQAAQKVMISH